METFWILVADSGRARLFEARGRTASLEELTDFVNPEGRSSGRALDNERPARVHDRVGEGRHAVEPPTGPQAKAADAFVRELVERLEQGRVEHCFDRLVLVAPPAFLGKLRKVLGDELAALVAVEVDKGLTQADAEGVRKALVKADEMLFRPRD